MAGKQASKRSADRISVGVRVRPLSRQEQSNGGSEAIFTRSTQDLVVEQRFQALDTTMKVREVPYRFDAVFGPEAQTEQLYDTLVQPLVAAVLRGQSSSCIAYGQTGSGKTYTMLGHPGHELGISVCAAHQLLHSSGGKGIEVSMYQIYCGEVYDLLTEGVQGQPLPVRMDKHGHVNIINLNAYKIDTPDDLQKAMDLASERRTTSSTSANAESSRSHAVLQLRAVNGALLSVVDLAGSEWGKDVQMCDQRTQTEGKEINKSLLALKEVIRSLGRGSNVNFRASVLTRVLQSCFAPGALCSIVATVSPAFGDVQHTLNTLLYANRIKELPSDARVAAAPRPAVQDCMPRLSTAPRKRPVAASTAAPPAMAPPTKRMKGATGTGSSAAPAQQSTGGRAPAHATPSTASRPTSAAPSRSGPQAAVAATSVPPRQQVPVPQQSQHPPPAVEAAEDREPVPKATASKELSPPAPHESAMGQEFTVDEDMRQEIQYLEEELACKDDEVRKCNEKLTQKELELTKARAEVARLTSELAQKQRRITSLEKRQK